MQTRHDYYLLGGSLFLLRLEDEQIHHDFFPSFGFGHEVLAPDLDRHCLLSVFLKLRNLGNGATIAQAGFDQLPCFAFGRLMIRQCDGPLGLLCFFPMRDCPRILLGIERHFVSAFWHCRVVDVQAAVCPVRAPLPVWSPGGCCSSDENDFVRQQQRRFKQTLGSANRQIKSFALRPETFFAQRKGFRRAPVVWSIAQHHPQRCRGIASLCVPYIPEGFAAESIIPLSDRRVYPENRFPAAQ
jgi:hypothetical protein